jgi:hypothetical protein
MNSSRKIFFLLGNRMSKTTFEVFSSGYFGTFLGIVKTTNSVSNWLLQGSPSGVYDTYFLNNLTGFYSNDTIYKTSNGGFNWFVVFPGSINNPCIKLKFINDNVGWSMNNHYIYKTTNSGNN